MIAPATSFRVLVAMSLLLAVSCGGGGASSEDGGVTPPADTTPPFTQPNPGPGTYSAIVTVTLASNEPATIYYTTDGNPPTVGGATTGSGLSPLPGIVILNDLTLAYFAIDAAGNVEATKFADYQYNSDPPIVLLTNPPTGLYGFLESVPVGFFSDQDGSYLLELGGTGEPGTGASLTSGQVQADVFVNAAIPGWRLPIGQQSPGNEVHLHVANDAGALTSIQLNVRTKSAETIDTGGNTEDIELTADGRFGFLLQTDTDEVWKIDTDPASGTYHTVLATIPVGGGATHMDLMSDSSRLYVTIGGGFAEVDVATGAVVPIAMPGGRTPSGLAIVDDAGHGLCVADDGGFWTLGVNPLAGDYRMPTALTIGDNRMDSGEVFLGPEQKKAIVVWSGPSDYGVKHLFTGNYFLPPTNMIEDVLPLSIGDAAFRSDGLLGWAGRGDGRLNLLVLSVNPPLAGNASNAVDAHGVTIAPDDSVLLLSGGPLVGIQIVDPLSMTQRKFVAAGGVGGGPTSRQVRFSPDGERAYLVRDNGLSTAQVWILGL
ncbi:MAG: hypothetical protein ACI9F9_001797 [Candidatus Paceibacteria bacterium]|jgi:hypothetical protein